jgi:uncharacterized protein
MRKTYLPDVNFWLAITFRSHTHHPIALCWFDAIGDGICHFCRMTQQGFLRLANNPSALPAVAVTSDVAWQLYDRISTDPRVAFASEPAGVELPWRRNTSGRQFTPKIWNDAYLAAFAEVGGYEVVTFDSGFSAFPNARATVLPVRQGTLP